MADCDLDPPGPFHPPCRGSSRPGDVSNRPEEVLPKPGSGRTHPFDSKPGIRVHGCRDIDSPSKGIPHLVF